MVDLTTTYMGMTLKQPDRAFRFAAIEDHQRHPPDGRCRRGGDHALFVVRGADRDRSAGCNITSSSKATESYAEAISYFPTHRRLQSRPGRTIWTCRPRRKQAVDVPVIASLNGVTTGGWIEYARKIEQAGADALECNVYLLPTWPNVTSVEVEQTYLEILQRGQGQRQHPGGDEAQPVLQRDARTWRTGWMRPARMRWCCSIASISPTSTWKS